MNTEGGILLVGIDDAGRPVGIEEDYPFVGEGRDGWEQWLTDLIFSTLGTVKAAGMKVRYCELDGKTVAHIEVNQATKPVFATPKKGANPSGRNPVHGEKKFFYVRMANGTRELAGEDMLEYIKNRWPI